MQYQSDDLFYDIEIRKNLFVLTQFFPKQHKFIISYLEGLTNFLNSNGFDADYEHGDLLSDYQCERQSILNFAKLNDPTGKKFIAKVSQHRNTTVNVKGQQLSFVDYTLQKLAHPFGMTDDVHQYLLKYINQENPSLQRTGNNHFEFENLANVADFQKFALRYGLATNLNDAINAWTPDRLNQKLLNFNNYNVFTYFENMHQQANDMYYPVKDLDLANSSMPSHPNNGKRIGWNTNSYDDTMIAHILNGDDSFNNNFYNTLPSAWNYYLANYQNVNGQNMTKQVHPQYGLTLQQITELLAMHHFYQSLNILQPANLVDFNERMFKAGYMPGALDYQSAAYYTKQAYANSNRFIDGMTLLPQPMPLKQVAAMFGFQIKESSSNSDPRKEQATLHDMADVIAYNVSDVFVTYQVFNLDGFQDTYAAREALVKDYPMLTYDHDDSKPERMAVADGNPKKLRFKRITTNSTNPRIMENIIAPYPNTKLVDDPVLNFMYPAKSVAEKLGIKQFDVLEDTMKYAKDNIPNGEQVFKPIYDYYNLFRGHNFNTQQNGAISAHEKIVSWEDDRVDGTTSTLEQVQQHAKTTPFTSADDITFEDYHGNLKTLKHDDFDNRNYKKFPRQSVPGDYVFIDPDDKTKTIASRGWYNASYGGIHGAEDKLDLYQKDLANQQQAALLANNLVQNNQLFTDLLPETALAQLNHDYVTTKDQYNNVDLPQQMFHTVTKVERKILKDAKAKPQKIVRFLNLNEKQKLTKVATMHNKKGTFQLKFGKSIDKFTAERVAKRYVYTSTGLARHQDFSSYYPTLTVMLKLAINVDGKDQYEVIYNQRMYNKQQSKNPDNSPAVRLQFKKKQVPQKLLLNSLTGMADAKGKLKSKVRVNNKILKMRIIGQLFAWRIGQALALKGATIVSTNTDGLYTMGIDEKTNDEVVKEQTAHMYLTVKPEEIDNFISANANNRIEVVGGKVNEAKGGTLTAWQGPLWNKRLSHPALNDRILMQYLTRKPDAVNQAFDYDFAKQQLNEFKNSLMGSREDKLKFLNFLQWITRSNFNSRQLIFMHALKQNEDQSWTLDRQQSPIFIEQTNRIFLITPAGQKVLNPEQKTPLSLFKATTGVVSTLSGVKNHIKTATTELANPFNVTNKADEKEVNECLNDWKPGTNTTSFVMDMDHKLLDSFIDDFEHSATFPEQLRRQQYYVNNDPLAFKVAQHYWNDLNLFDDQKGIYDHTMASINPKKLSTRDKITDWKLEKITDFPTNNFVYINNRALADYSDQLINDIIKYADYDKYLNIVRSKFESAWQN